MRFRSAALLSLALFCLRAFPAHAQIVRYIAHGVGGIVSGTPTCEAIADAKHNSEETSCDEGVVTCFENPSGCSTAMSQPGCCVIGGARDENGNPRPGIPRVASEGGGASFPINGTTIIVPGVAAIADAGTRNLVSSCGPVTIRNSSGDTVLPPRGAIQVQGVGLLLSCVETRTVHDGLSVITIAGAILITTSGQTIILSQAKAGVEIPFERGGASCAISPRRQASRLDVGVVALVAGLWLIERRRRRT